MITYKIFIPRYSQHCLSLGECNSWLWNPADDSTLSYQETLRERSAPLSQLVTHRSSEACVNGLTFRTATLPQVLIRSYLHTGGQSGVSSPRATSHHVSGVVRKRRFRTGILITYLSISSIARVMCEQSQLGGFPFLGTIFELPCES